MTARALRRNVRLRIPGLRECPVNGACPCPARTPPV